MSTYSRFLLKNRALQHPLFRRYLIVRFFLIMALNLQTTVLVYWVYQLTRDVASVGLMGLFEAIPAIGFSLISGHFADQREKRTMIMTCISAYLLLSAAYITLSLLGRTYVPDNRLTVSLIYAGIFVGGTLRAFVSPATFALLGMLVPRRHLLNAGTWSSSSWQLGAIIGPLLAGFLIAGFSVTGGLIAAFAFVGVALAGIAKIPKQPILKKEKEPVFQSLKEGLRFVFSTQIVLAALMLDMFAVLFGGATALLPAYVDSILGLPEETKEIAFGWLRAAPGIGAIIMYFIFANKPLRTNPGPKLLFCIAGFGASIIVFGLSHWFWLSLLVLMVSGAFDAVSVVIRGTILQLYTPDDMRGRVAAVNTMFISSSNELGEVESGFTAKWMGTVPSVVFGGCMTLLVAGGTWFAAPRLKAMKFEDAVRE